uniref:hypothetical protein n=1 Tax=Sandarakinorhabdus sp. TaxID=1916663 RepID=UPI00333EA869
EGAASSIARQSTALIRLSRRWPALELAGLLRLDDERGSLAGTRLSSGFGLNGGSSISIGVAARLLIGGFELAGDWRRARSRLALGPGLITAAGPLHGDAGSLMLSRGHLLLPGDRFSLAVTRPLAIAGPLWLAGGAAPVRFGPNSRETALEATYLRPLPAGGTLQFALFHRDHPGHIAAAPPDQGAALRLWWGW